MTKPTFLRNFWEGFSEVLGPRHVIQSLDKCDFTPIYEWHMAERERKKALSKEVRVGASVCLGEAAVAYTCCWCRCCRCTAQEKLKLKEEREAAEAKFHHAWVDGRKEKARLGSAAHAASVCLVLHVSRACQPVSCLVDPLRTQVGNFRVEPPGLFRGRGEHPKMGRIKKRIYPRDIVINIGEGEPVPEHPYPGEPGGGCVCFVRLPAHAARAPASWLQLPATCSRARGCGCCCCCCLAASEAVLPLCPPARACPQARAGRRCGTTRR